MSRALGRIPVSRVKKPIKTTDSVKDSEELDNLRAQSRLRQGIFGAIVNIMISGSGLSCVLWVAASATLSSRVVSDIPGFLLVFAIPLLLIGFAAGWISTSTHWGLVMTASAALLGSVGGLLASVVVLDYLGRTVHASYEGYPIFEYASWIILAITIVGVLLATVVIGTASIFRRIVHSSA